MAKNATFSFRGELNDFLPPGRKFSRFEYEFTGKPSLKDAVEAIGAPHVEVDVILRNAVSASFRERLGDGDAVEVFPSAEAKCIPHAVHLIPAPLPNPRFILDVHLGKLAVYLRLLGFDTFHRNHLDDPEIAAIAQREDRIALTRDIALLKNGAITRGRWIRSQKPRLQLGEAVRYFELSPYIKPFTRCTVCNGIVEEAPPESVRDRLEPRTSLYYNEFYRCSSCGRIYWKGSHYPRLLELIHLAEQMAVENQGNC
ncbi:MAG: Mut7-C RNAse domain-containing protein [Candidatus Latescibacterota bacterium]